jgi:esterase/lipase superfamily enzyme
VELTDERCPLRYGTTQVRLPVPGSTVETITSFEQGLVVEERRIHSNPDDALGAVASATDWLVYIHGCCNSFEDSVKRAALVAMQQRRIAGVALFAWPSGDTLLSYVADRKKANSEVSEDLSDAVGELGGRISAPDVLAHSLGVRAFVRAFGSRPTSVPIMPGNSPSFDRVVLAAGDELHRSFAENYPGHRSAASTSLYAYDPDGALEWARRLARSADEAAPRVGEAGADLVDLDPMIADVIDTSDAVGRCGRSDNDCFHSYFVMNDPVAQDLTLATGGEAASGVSRNLQIVPAANGRQHQHFALPR